MKEYASFKLSRQLFHALGKPDFKIANQANFYAQGINGKYLGSTIDGFKLTQFSKFIPAFNTDQLFDMAVEAGHNPIKFKQEGRKIILTSPPCNHIEATSRPDALAKLLIRSLKSLSKKGA